MALSEAEYERIQVLLENLESVRAQLYPKAQTFVDDQISRFSQYGNRMLVSPKQKQWLEDLHREFCKEAPELPGENESPWEDDDPRF